MKQAFEPCLCIASATCDADSFMRYDPKIREYTVELILSSGEQGIYYCPWCGCMLPCSLRDTYFETLESDYGLSSSDVLENPEAVPKEFKTDTWWKKRGL